MAPAESPPEAAEDAEASLQHSTGAKTADEVSDEDAAADAEAACEAGPHESPEVTWAVVKRATLATAATDACAATDVAASAVMAVGAAEAAEPTTLQVPSARLGAVLRDRGDRLVEIHSHSGVGRIDISGNTLTFVGNPAAVRTARRAVQELVASGCCSLLRRDLVSETVLVHPCHFPALVGRDGEVLRRIRERYQVDVAVPPPRSIGGNPMLEARKLPVRLTGGRAQLEEVKEVIQSIAFYQHHEVTHPGVVHEEISVETWQYPFVRCERRRVERRFDVRCCFPTTHSSNRHLLLLGGPRGVPQAAAHIRRLLRQAEVLRWRVEPQEDGGDYWGEEPEPEEWMKCHLYSR